LAGVVESAAAKSPALPDWVLQAANAKLPEYPPGTKAVVLLEDKMLTVRPDGKAVERYRSVIKILRQQGRSYATVVVPFSNDYKLNTLHVWSIGPDGRQYTVKDDQIREEGNDEWGMLYVDERAKIVVPPGADPNGIVAYESEQTLPAYLNEEGWYFQNPIPTVHSVFDLVLPEQWKYYAAWLRHDAQVPSEISPNHWHWEMHDIPGIDLDDVPMAPSEGALAERMVVHFSAKELPEGDGRWAEIGNWYDDLASPRTEGPIEVNSMAKSLTYGSSDFTERIQKIAEFMQRDIRYVGIEIGIGGLQPHPAADVFRNRYGDCKDKVTLLISMLSAVGVRSTYVLVDTRRGIVDPLLPSIRGNHAIAAIELPASYHDPQMQAIVTAKTGKRYLIFDPTNEYSPIGLLPSYLQGGYGILVASKNSQVIRLPILKPDSDLVNRSAKFQLAKDGTLTGTVTENRFGSSAEHMRRVFNETGKIKQHEALENALGNSFSNFTLDSQSAENVENLDKQLVLNYTVTAKGYAKLAGENLLLVRPRVLGTVEAPFNQKPRVYPFDMGQTGRWRDNFEVSIPPGYVVDDLPNPMNVDVGFATYHSEVKADSTTLYYKRELVIKELELGPQKYPELRKLEATIATDENNNAVLKKQSAATP
jgi:hypothetical protein